MLWILPLAWEPERHSLGKTVSGYQKIKTLRSDDSAYLHLFNLIGAISREIGSKSSKSKFFENVV
jgi:hypothetical protein